MSRVLQRVILASLFFFALFIPFSIAGMTIALGFGAVAWVFSWFMPGNNVRPVAPGFTRRIRHPMALPALLLVVFALPSVILSEDAGRALRDWSSYWTLLVLFFVSANLRHDGTRSLVFWALVVSGSLSALVGFVQRAGGVDFGFVHIGAEYRVSSTLYTMTFAGILYQLIVLNCSVLFTHGMRLHSRMVLGVVVALQFVAILLTMTRGAWLALVAGILALCMLVRGRLAVGLAVALVVSLTAVAFVNFHVQEGRSIPELIHSGLDRDASTRVVLWDIAWHLFRQNAVLGVGMGDFTTEANALLAGRQVTTTVDTHNVYLHVLATRGLVGFLPFAFFWTMLFVLLFRLKRRLPRGSVDYQYVVGAIAVTVAVLVGGLTELNIDDAEVWLAFMFVTGLAFSCSGATGEEPDMKDAAPLSPRHRA